MYLADISFSEDLCVGMSSYYSFYALKLQDYCMLQFYKFFCEFIWKSLLGFPFHE